MTERKCEICGHLAIYHDDHMGCGVGKLIEGQRVEPWEGMTLGKYAICPCSWNGRMAPDDIPNRDEQDKILKRVI